MIDPFQQENLEHVLQMWENIIDEQHQQLIGEIDATNNITDNNNNNNNDNDNDDNDNNNDNGNSAVTTTSTPQDINRANKKSNESEPSTPELLREKRIMLGGSGSKNNNNSNSPEKGTPVLVQPLNNSQMAKKILDNKEKKRKKRIEGIYNNNNILTGICRV